jgi:hypothetical protein
VNAQQLIDLLRENKAKSLDELDGNATKAILESINAFSVSECKDFKDIAETIALGELDDPHPLAVFFICFLKHHFSPESCIELFKKLIGIRPAFLFTREEKRKLEEEYKSLEFDELQLEMEPDRYGKSTDKMLSELSIRKKQIIKIVEEWNDLCVIASSDEVIQPYQFLLISDFIIYGNNEKLVIRDLKTTLISVDEPEKVTKLATLWDSIMSQKKYRTALRELYIDSPDGSNAKKNAGRALKLLGEIPPSETMENNKIEVTIGSGNTFYGDIAIAKIMQDSFNKATSANTSSEIKELLEQLAIAVAKMSESFPKDEASRAARALDIMIDEASSKNPNREWWKVSADGLAKAAENVGKIGKPVLEILGKLVPILLAMAK